MTGSEEATLLITKIEGCFEREHFCEFLISARKENEFRITFVQYEVGATWFLRLMLEIIRNSRIRFIFWVLLSVFCHLNELVWDLGHSLFDKTSFQPFEFRDRNSKELKVSMLS